MRPCISTSSRQHPPSVPAPWPSHLPCLTPATGSTAFHLLRWVFTFKTRSFGAVCATGWEYPFTAPPTPVPNAITQQTPLGTTNFHIAECMSLCTNVHFDQEPFYACNSASTVIYPGLAIGQDLWSIPGYWTGQVVELLVELLRGRRESLGTRLHTHTYSPFIYNTIIYVRMYSETGHQRFWPSQIL